MPPHGPAPQLNNIQYNLKSLLFRPLLELHSSHRRSPQPLQASAGPIRAPHGQPERHTASSTRSNSSHYAEKSRASPTDLGELTPLFEAVVTSGQPPGPRKQAHAVVQRCEIPQEPKPGARANPPTECPTCSACKTPAATIPAPKPSTPKAYKKPFWLKPPAAPA